MEKKTPLYDCHVKYGGKIVPFAGYLLPVQYGEGVIAEHMAVRTKAGLFDVSHMGEVIFEGPDAFANVQKLVTNDCTGLEDGRVRYSPMCNEAGGVVDDLIIYRYNEEKYLLVVNASNKDKDVAWMKQHLFGDVTFTDISDSLAQIALQGPKAFAIMDKLAASEDIPRKYYSFSADVKVAGINCILSQTGYTGESGFEIYCAPEDASAMWEAIMEAGAEFGLIPCGLGARDTLRLEAAMPLYGHEMDDEITPIETNLKIFVKLDKPDFIGREALIAKGEPTRKRVGLEITGRGIAREHCKVYAGDREIGFTTSGTHCPFIGKAVAMAIIDKDFIAIDTELEVDVRGRRIAAKVIKLPFYKAN